MNVRVKLDDSRYNRSRDIRAAHFVMDDEEDDIGARMSSPKKPTTWWGRQNAAPSKIQLKAVECDIFCRFFSIFDICRPEVASDVISGLLVGQMSVWLSVQNLVILGQTVFEILEPLTFWWKTTNGNNE